MLFQQYNALHSKKDFKSITRDSYLKGKIKFCFFTAVLSSRGGLEVEQWSDNRTLSISVDQSPLGACIILWYQWTRYVIYVCKLKGYIIHREIEHYSQAAMS